MDKSIMALGLFFSILIGPLASAQSPEVMQQPKEPRVSPDLELNVSTVLERKAIIGNNLFAVDLYKQLLADASGKEGEESGNKNLFYSPYSISNVIGMAFLASREGTSRQIAQVMHFPAAPDAQAELFAAITQKIESPRGSVPCPLQVSNSLWHDPQLKIQPGYVEGIQRYFGGYVEQISFADPEMVCSKVNAWVQQNTGGLIPRAMAPQDLHPTSRHVLVNTVYFDAPWGKPFKRTQTKENPFFDLDHRQLCDVPLMYENTSFRYAEVDRVQVVEKLYKHPDFSMLFILPPSGKPAWQRFESKLDISFFAQANQRMRNQEVKLYVPRFEIECVIPTLDDALVQMGMPQAFDPEKADFQGVTGSRGRSLYKVVHKAVLRVDEEKTVAAAVTYGDAFGGDFSTKPIVRLDRPFILAIMHRPSGMILFIGRVMRPVPLPN